MDVVHEPLRALAGSDLRSQPAHHTLQPTALVHEVFPRLVDPKEADRAMARAWLSARHAEAS